MISRDPRKFHSFPSAKPYLEDFAKVEYLWRRFMDHMRLMYRHLRIVLMNFRPLQQFFLLSGGDGTLIDHQASRSHLRLRGRCPFGWSASRFWCHRRRSTHPLQHYLDP